MNSLVTCLWWQTWGIPSFRQCSVGTTLTAAGITCIEGHLPPPSWPQRGKGFSMRADTGQLIQPTILSSCILFIFQFSFSFLHLKLLSKNSWEQSCWLLKLVANKNKAVFSTSPLPDKKNKSMCIKVCTHVHTQLFCLHQLLWFSPFLAWFSS